MDLDLQLSMLAAGELAPADETALRARIASEPAVAEAWDAMQLVLADLDGISDEAPPAHLDARVLGQTRAPDAPVGISNGFRWTGVAGWSVAAAAAVALVAVASWPRSPVVLSATPGTQHIEGYAHVDVGDVDVIVDGSAELSVEPAPEVLREWRAQEESMDWTHAASALAGATISIVVQQGIATVQGPDGPVEVQAGGQYETVAPGAPDGPKAGGDVAQAQVPTGPAPTTVEALQQENAQLREALALQTMEAKIARGQLTQAVGKPAEWPAQTPAGLQPDAFEAVVTDLLEDFEGLELATLDCAEYPCVAQLTTTDAARLEEDGRAMSEALGQAMGEALGEDMGGMLVMMGETEDGDGAVGGTVGLAVLPSNDPDGSLQRRAAIRVQEAMESDLGADLPIP